MRRGAFGLVLALVIVTLVGTTLSLLALHAARMYEQRNQERARTYARALADSGESYAKTHAGEWRARGPQVVALPAADLLPRGVRGELVCTCEPGETVRIDAAVSIGAARATERRFVQAEPPTATRPAAAH